jgi:hypothetical protein
MINDPELLRISVEQHREELWRTMRLSRSWGVRLTGAFQALLGRPRSTTLNRPFASRSMPRA